jgi:hypothetical protein
MGIDYWLDLYRSVVIREREQAMPLPKPTVQMIADFERRTQFALPRGYIDFLKVFGPGELAWEYDIKAPGYPERGEAVDLETYNANLHERLKQSFRFLRLKEDVDRAVRMIFFCRTGAGESVGWDPLDVQDPDNQEYGIYLFTRTPSVVTLACTFEEFIENVCLGDVNLNIPGWDVEECGPRRAFDPAYALPPDPS